MLLAAALLASGVATVSFETHLLRRPEQQTLDARYQIRGSQRRRGAGVVLVLVDASTFDYYTNHEKWAQWPFPRQYDARVIENLHRAGAKVIAFDAQFSERTDAAEDGELLEAIEGARPGVVLSTTESEAGGRTPVLGGEAKVREVGARVGDANIVPDSDGVLRGMQHTIEGVRTLGVAIAEADSGRPVAPSLFGGAGTRVPIDYVGAPGTFQAIPFWRVYSGDFPARTFAGKIAIVGTSAPSLQDLHQTPLSAAPMPGPEVVANEAATVLGGIPLRDAPSATTVILIVLFALIACVATMAFGTLGVALSGIAVLLAWALAAQIAFDSGTVLDFSDPAAALLLATGAATLMGIRADGRERKRLRALFAANSEAVVGEVLAGGGGRALEPTAIIAGYRIEAPIARGGMGVVYRATQLALQRPVAIKLIAADRAADPVFRARFERESRLSASIEHPNVIPVYEAGDDDGLLFIAMRLVDGTDLADVLVQEGALEPARAARLVGQLAGALDAAHAVRLVHRDVKPANVLLTADRPEHLYLTDFGVAKHVGGGEGMTRAGAWVGTIDYLAPEQVRGEAVGPAADIYALAAVLHHCLTGEVPFPRENDAARLWAHVNASPPAASSIRTRLPASIDAVLARGMAKEPAARFATAGELARECAAALGVAVEVPVPPAAGADEPARRPHAPVSPTVVSE